MYLNIKAHGSKDDTQVVVIGRVTKLNEIIIFFQSFLVMHYVNYNDCRHTTDIEYA